MAARQAPPPNFGGNQMGPGHGHGQYAPPNAPSGPRPNPPPFAPSGPSGNRGDVPHTPLHAPKVPPADEMPVVGHGDKVKREAGELVEDVKEEKDRESRDRYRDERERYDGHKSERGDRSDKERESRHRDDRYERSGSDRYDKYAERSRYDDKDRSRRDSRDRERRYE